MRRIRRTVAATMTGMFALGLAACGGNADTGGTAAGGGTTVVEDDTVVVEEAGTGEDCGTTEIEVVGLLPGSDPAAIAALEEQAQQFMDANPDIIVDVVEYHWQATTFAAQLAGGTLPDVFEIPFTDAQTLIQNGQLANMDAQFRTLPYADLFNPDILAAGEDASGQVYAIPAMNVYGVGLHYNRELFESAGLDPDSPPTSWDQVREYAKAIADANPGVAGYMQMSQNNTGGWQLTVQNYARGGRVQELHDDGTATATINDPATLEALQWLHDMRWEDNSLGSNFLMDWGTINQAFASGQIAMFTSGSDVYTSMVQTNNIDPAMYGLAALPLNDDPNAGVLTGGTLAAVPAGRDACIKDAAIKWIDFRYTGKLIDEAAAVQDARTLFEAGQPVGTPVLPMFSEEQWRENQEWIADYINVPLDQMSSYIDAMFDQKLVGEPSRDTQEFYALMDPVVQAVLTDEHADIPALLEQANTQAQALLDASNPS